MTEYVVLIIGDADRWWKTMTEQERKDGYAEYGRFAQQLAERGHRVVGGAELKASAPPAPSSPAATTVTDGPFTETAEQVGGYFESTPTTPTTSRVLQDHRRARRRRAGGPHGLPTGARVVKYLVLLIGDGEDKPWTEQTDEEKHADVMAKFGEFDAALRGARGRRAARG